jgi:hypothetical protein
MNIKAKPVIQKVCVLYDPHTGRIAHTHLITTFVGGREVSDVDTEARCKSRAQSMGHAVAGLGVLHVPPTKYVKSGMYYVDVTTKKLSQVPLPARK